MQPTLEPIRQAFTRGRDVGGVAIAKPSLTSPGREFQPLTTPGNEAHPTFYPTNIQVQPQRPGRDLFKVPDIIMIPNLFI